jgi:hypothetical protein
MLVDSEGLPRNAEPGSGAQGSGNPAAAEERLQDDPSNFIKAAVISASLLITLRL